MKCLKNILNNFEFMTKNHPYKTTKYKCIILVLTDFLLEVYLNTSFSTLLQNFSLPRPVIHKIQVKTHKNTKNTPLYSQSLLHCIIYYTYSRPGAGREIHCGIGAEGRVGYPPPFFGQGVHQFKPSGSKSWLNFCLHCVRVVFPPFIVLCSTKSISLKNLKIGMYRRYVNSAVTNCFNF